MEWQAARTRPVQNPPQPKSPLAYSIVRFLTPPQLEADAENLRLLLESLADGWISKLLMEVGVPCSFHLRLFSFAGVRGVVFCPVLAACLDPEVPFRIYGRQLGNCVAVPRLPCRLWLLPCFA